MEKKSESFGRLLKAGIASIARCEGKTERAVEADLGAQIGVAGDTIQRYKTGYLPPDPRTVQILAEACVRRGMLGREWLQKFLHAARYPGADQLVDTLCPIGPARPRPPRVYANLPAPTYSQFIMREQAFAEVIDGLAQRSAAVLIVGLGGSGKTSLAREVAARCLRDGEEAPRFDAAVWVSDKDRPGTTNLSTALDEIARTLDYPGFTQFAHDEKRHEVEQLLRRQPVLLVIDNFETITDGALLTWLLRLPEPSKALVTSREYSRAFRNSTMVTELRGMSEAEAHALVRQRLRHLRIATLLSDESPIDTLIAATGGNPKAIEITLGLVKHERRPLPQVVDDLYSARGDLFDDLFARAWALLDEAARRVLLVATFFPTSASAAALSASADVQGFAFDRAVERLADLALLDVQQADLGSPPRYALHPLVRAFVGAKLREQPEFERGARERWIEWHIQFAARVGYCWDDLDRLDNLDPEYASIHHVIMWCFKQDHFHQLIRLVKEVFFYYHVRGLWHQQPSIFTLAAEAAMHIGDQVEEVRYLAMRIKYLSWQDKTDEAGTLVAKLAGRIPSLELPNDVVMMYRQAAALHLMNMRDYNAAQRLLEQSISIDRTIEDKQTYNANKHWLAVSLYHQGQLKAAQSLLQEALAEAIPYHVQRATFAHPMRLIQIDLDLNDLEAAEARIAQIRPRAYAVKDRRYIALIQDLSARLHVLRGDLPAARAAYAEAIDLFERLGMRRELAEARQALAELGAGAEQTTD